MRALEGNAQGYVKSNGMVNVSLGYFCDLRRVVRVASAQPVLPRCASYFQRRLDIYGNGKKIQLEQPPQQVLASRDIPLDNSKEAGEPDSLILDQWVQQRTSQI
ncbi:MAG TPA: hypothetical protein VK976_12065 [Verrucomicrobiae bacterium]|jgi:hypothetical protein|nr:hypothetical protein [Verrucomicrobiae bacterium]